jgi:hypothetical protein
VFGRISDVEPLAKVAALGNSRSPTFPSIRWRSFVGRHRAERRGRCRAFGPGEVVPLGHTQYVTGRHRQFHWDGFAWLVATVGALGGAGVVLVLDSSQDDLISARGELLLILVLGCVLAVAGWAAYRTQRFAYGLPVFLALCLVGGGGSYAWASQSGLRDMVCFATIHVSGHPDPGDVGLVACYVRAETRGSLSALQATVDPDLTATTADLGQGVHARAGVPSVRFASNHLDGFHDMVIIRWADGHHIQLVLDLPDPTRLVWRIELGTSSSQPASPPISARPAPAPTHR